MRKFLSLLSVVFFFSPPSFASQKYEAVPGKASFEAVGKPSFVKIQGQGATVEGAVEIEGVVIKGEFQVQLSQFTTGIETRDSHMKDQYFEVQKYPKAILKIDSVALPEKWTVGVEAKEVPFKGQLTLKDVSKPLEGKVTVSAGEMSVKATFTMKMSDYPSLGVPSWKGITVADNVTVQVDIPKFTRK